MAGLLSALFSARPTASSPYVDVDHVIDGDTILATVDPSKSTLSLVDPLCGKNIATSFRLIGIDSAELNSMKQIDRKHAQRAREYLQKMMDAAYEVRVETDRSDGSIFDEYNRVLVYVWFRVTPHGKWYLANEEMVRAGLAKPYKYRTRRYKYDVRIYHAQPKHMLEERKRFIAQEQAAFGKRRAKKRGVYY